VFHHHEEISADLAAAILRRLKYSNAVAKSVVNLIRNHMFSYKPEWTDAAVRRFLRRVGVDCLEDLFALRIADGYGMRRQIPGDRDISDLRRRIDMIIQKEQAFSIKDLAVNGSDLADAGIPKGPDMGKVLDFLLETVIDDPSQNEKSCLIPLAVKFYSSYITSDKKD